MPGVEGRLGAKIAPDFEIFDSDLFARNDNLSETRHQLSVLLIVFCFVYVKICFILFGICFIMVHLLPSTGPGSTKLASWRIFEE